MRLPSEIRSQVTIHLVDDVLEVLGRALATPPVAADPPQDAEPPAPPPRAARRAGSTGPSRRRRPTG